MKRRPHGDGNISLATSLPNANRDVLLNLHLYNSHDGRRYRVSAAAQDHTLREDEEQQKAHTECRKPRRGYGTSFRARKHAKSCTVDGSYKLPDALPPPGEEANYSIGADKYVASWVEKLPEHLMKNDHKKNTPRLNTFDRRKDLVGYVKKQLEKRQIVG